MLVACGFALMLRYGINVSIWTDVLPALLVFSLGLAMTVAPLTATVLADASEAQAGNRLGGQQRDRADGGFDCDRRGRGGRLVLLLVAARPAARRSPARRRPNRR